MINFKQFFFSKMVLNLFFSDFLLLNILYGVQLWMHLHGRPTNAQYNDLSFNHQSVAAAMLGHPGTIGLDLRSWTETQQQTNKEQDLNC